MEISVIEDDNEEEEGFPLAAAREALLRLAALPHAISPDPVSPAVAFAAVVFGLQTTSVTTPGAEDVAALPTSGATGLPVDDGAAAAAAADGHLETFLMRRTVSTVSQSTRTSGSKNASCRPIDGASLSPLDPRSVAGAWMRK